MNRRIFLLTCLGTLGVQMLFSNSSASKMPRFPSLQNKFQPTEVLVKILGTAQDGGIPHMGCFCQNCERARKNPRFRRLISSLAVFDLKDKKSFLIDATPDIRRQTHMMAERSNRKTVQKTFVPDAVLLTHAHIGHYTGLMFYGYEAQSTHQLPVYCSKRMAAFLKNNGPWSQLVEQKNISLHSIQEDQTISLTSRVNVTAFQVPHRHEFSDTLGFKVSGKKKSLLYIPDIQSWESWHRSIIRETKKVNTALLDGTFYSSEELPSRDLSSIGHPFIEDSVHLLKNVAEEGGTEIFFTHLNHSNLALDPEGEPRKNLRKKGFRLASDGMEFYL